MVFRQYMGVAQNQTTRNWTAGFTPWFHLPGQAILGLPHFGPAAISESQVIHDPNFNPQVLMTSSPASPLKAVRLVASQPGCQVRKRWPEQLWPRPWALGKGPTSNHGRGEVICGLRWVVCVFAFLNGDLGAYFWTLYIYIYICWEMDFPLDPQSMDLFPKCRFSKWIFDWTHKNSLFAVGSTATKWFLSLFRVCGAFARPRLSLEAHRSSDLASGVRGAHFGGREAQRKTIPYP